MDIQSNVPTEMNMDYPRLVLNTILRMRDAKADRQIEKYLTYFDFSMWLLSPYIAHDAQDLLDNDRKDFLTRLKNIRETQTNDTNRMNMELGLKESFCDAHANYIFSAFGKAGIIKIMEEGVIPFDTRSFDEIKAIVRSGGMGAPSALKRIEERKESGKLE